MNDDPKLTRREWQALGSLLLPAVMGGKITLGPKMGPKLKTLGLVEEFEDTLAPGPNDPAWLRLKRTGWRMTARGHIIYCAWAAKQRVPDDGC